MKIRKIRQNLNFVIWKKVLSNCMWPPKIKIEIERSCFFYWTTTDKLKFTDGSGVQWRFGSGEIVIFRQGGGRNHHPMSENRNFAGTKPPLDLKPVCIFKFVRCGPVEKTENLVLPWCYLDLALYRALPFQVFKFGQDQVSNSWYIPDMDKCRQDKCCLDNCHRDSWNLF